MFEHLTQPFETLQLLYSKMKPGGKLIIEVPHANDFLLSFLNLESFKEFTFWSEHLILHTRITLSAFLKKSQFKNIIIQGCQRYPLANHLYWVKNNLPGGHIKWSELRTAEMDREYSHFLKSINMTDTLIAYAEK